MFHSFHNCCQSFLFSQRNKLGLKRHKKNAKMQDICNKETKTTAASLGSEHYICSCMFTIKSDTAFIVICFSGTKKLFNNLVRSSTSL